MSRMTPRVPGRTLMRGQVNSDAMTTPTRTIGLRVAIAVAVGALTMVPGVSGAHAASDTPGQPIIEQIVARATGGAGTVAVTVTFARAGTKPWATVQATEVKVGSLICLASKPVWKWAPGAAGPAATCTLWSVPAGKTLKVSARAKNKYGFGAWSPPVSFRTNAGRIWQRGR